MKAFALYCLIVTACAQQSDLDCLGTACHGETRALNQEMIQASMNGMDSFLQRALDRGAERYFASQADMSAFGSTPEEKTLLVTGNTAMHMAAFFGHLSTLELLLQNDYDIREASAIGVEQNGAGATPLMLAATKDHEVIVAALLYHGSDVAIQDTSGKTAMDYAASERVLAILQGLDGAKVEDVYTPKAPPAPEVLPDCAHQEDGCTDEEMRTHEGQKLLREAGEHVHGGLYALDGVMHEFDSETQQYTMLKDALGDPILAESDASAAEPVERTEL